MERWVGRVALVTGSSAGIGAAICEMLVRNGMKVVGVARRVENTQALAETLKGEKGSLMAVKCDVTKDEEVYATFEDVKKAYGGVDICVNNAGINFNQTLLDGTPDKWRRLLDVNVVALCLFTKLSIESMRERGIDDGQIINVNSIGGHQIFPDGATHMYSGSKFAVKAITEGLRQELREAKLHIRVSAISPGLVKTEIISRMYDSEEVSKQVYSSNLFIEAREIADVAQHILSAPNHVEMSEVIVQPTCDLISDLPK